MDLKNTGNEDLKIGDIVMADDMYQYEDKVNGVAIVLEVNIDMWGEEELPSGVKIQWPDGLSEIVYSDEIFSVNETE